VLGVEARVSISPLVETIRASVIGANQVRNGPYGPRLILYADYTAGGAADRRSARARTRRSIKREAHRSYVDG
jgi:hypothetical protein